MSRPVDTSAATTPSAESLLEMDLSSGQIANVTVTSAETLTAQTLRRGDSHSDDASNAEDIEMTVIKNMTTNKTMKTDQKITDKMNFKRKCSSDKDATSQVFLARVSSPLPEREGCCTDLLGQLRPSAPAVQSDNSTPISNTSHGHHQIKSNIHTKPSFLGHAAWKASLTKVLNEARCRRAAQAALDQVHSGSGTIVLPLAQDYHNEAYHVASQTSMLQGGQGQFFLPSSSSISTGTLSLPFDVSDPKYACFCQTNITTKLTGQSNNHTSRHFSIDQGSGGPSLQVSLDPSALPFTPRPILNSENLEHMQLGTAPFMGQNGSYRSFPPFSTSSSASQFCPQQISATLNTQVIVQNGVTVSTPTANTAVARHMAVSPTPRSSWPSSTAAPVVNNSVPPTTPSSRSARRPLPDLPTPPSTPSLSSSARFGDLLPHRKPHKSTISLTLINPPRPKLMKRQNPFVDLILINGNDPPETYYKFNPIMRTYRQHQLITNPGIRKIGPYRKAAVWEFIGQTFEKGARKGLKLKQRKRFQTYAAGAVPVPGTSSLSRQAMNIEEEHAKEQYEMDVLQEWGKLMNGEGDW